MNEYLIYLEVPAYLAQWARRHFGDPVELPRDSVESRLVKRMLDKEPSDVPDLSGNLRLKIPMSKEKDPRSGWTYLSPCAKRCLQESLYTIFLQNLWSELGDLQNVNCELTSLIYAWLEKHGIDESQWETIRQKYYRLRKLYACKGVRLTT